jgi:dTDP-4-amino-4,6-dideoxygalactose transaminase
LDPNSVEKKITPRTKAILVVHIFGHPTDMDPIMALAKKHSLKVIEDCAQSPYGRYKDRLVGTIGDIGVFSFNYHKHIHTGEGGMITTNDDELADRMRLIRNHAEAVVEAKGNTDLLNMLGYNYRMTEIEAAIGESQVSRLPGIVSAREENAHFYRRELEHLPGLQLPVVKFDSRHTYYLHAIRFDEKVVGVHRNTFVNALKAELPSAIGRETTPIVGAGYVRPLYLQPLYQKRAASCSFNCSKYSGAVDYSKGLCPVAEKMHFNEVFTSEYIRESFSDEDRKDVVRAFTKIYENIKSLKDFENAERGKNA